MNAHQYLSSEPVPLGDIKIDVSRVSNLQMKQKYIFPVLGGFSTSEVEKLGFISKTKVDCILHLTYYAPNFIHFPTIVFISCHWTQIYTSVWPVRHVIIILSLLKRFNSLINQVAREDWAFILLHDCKPVMWHNKRHITLLVPWEPRNMDVSHDESNVGYLITKLLAWVVYLRAQAGLKVLASKVLTNKSSTYPNWKRRPKNIYTA